MATILANARVDKFSSSVDAMVTPETAGCDGLPIQDHCLQEHVELASRSVMCLLGYAQSTKSNLSNNSNWHE